MTSFQVFCAIESDAWLLCIMRFLPARMIQWILAERMEGDAHMKKNRLGTSELMVSEIGLGCMSLGTEVEHAMGLIHEALDHGVNLLDTADCTTQGVMKKL